MNLPLSSDWRWRRGSPCPFDEIIDVRSPMEYAEDHVPSAINRPVLNDDERAEVGTVYRVEGAFAARKLGAAYVSANIGRHLREHFTSRTKDYKPLIYCWRGGQRSASLAIVLAQVGWRVTVLQGGYRTYREHVRVELESIPPLFEYRLIAGATGTGKTMLLHALARRGAQVLDLEALAGHRGSLLGEQGTQPSQKWFESRLLAAFERFDSALPVWVEAESNRIGNLHVPPALWNAMRTAAGVELRAPMAERVRQLLADYAHFLAAPDVLRGLLGRIARRHGPRRLLEWNRQIDASAWGDFVASLLTVHYDPAYALSYRRWFPNASQPVELTNTTPDTMALVAEELLRSSTGRIVLTSPANTTSIPR